MATLNSLRNKSGILLAVIIGIALIAFLLGDLISSGNTLIGSSKMNVGKINGEKISTQEYGELINSLTEVQRITTGQQGVNEEQTEMLKTQAWDITLRERAFVPAASEIGLNVAEDEMVELISGNQGRISPLIAQMFANQQTGMYDPAYLQAFVAQVGQDQTGSMQLFWNYLQDEVEAQQLRAKFADLMQKACYVTKFEAEQSAGLAAKTANLRYVVDRYTSIPDSTVAVTDREIRAYYDKHQEVFRQEDVREIAYVSFEALPSPNDYAEAEKKIHQIATELATATDVQQFVSLNSQIPFDARYHNPSDFSGELATFVATATPDQIYGPVLNGDQWTTARIADVAVLPDSVELRHIALAGTKTQLADSLMKVIQKGGDFVALAASFSEDPQTAQDGGKIGLLDPQTLTPQFAEALQGAKVGETKLVNTGNALHLVQVMRTIGESKKIQIGLITHNIEANEITRADAYAKAGKFATEAKGDFEASVTKDALARRVATFRSDESSVGGLPQSRELVRWAFNGKQGDVSEVMEFGNHFVIAKVADVRAKGVATFEQAKAFAKEQVVLQKKGELLAAKQQGAASLDELAAKLNLQVIEAPEITFQSFMAPEVGFDPAFVGGALAAKTGTLSKPIVGRIGVYGVQPVSESIAAVDPLVEKARLMAEAQQSAFAAAYQAVIEMTDVQDTRYRFY